MAVERKSAYLDWQYENEQELCSFNIDKEDRACEPVFKMFEYNNTLSSNPAEKEGAIISAKLSLLYENRLNSVGTFLYRGGDFRIIDGDSCEDYDLNDEKLKDFCDIKAKIYATFYYKDSELDEPLEFYCTRLSCALPDFYPIMAVVNELCKENKIEFSGSFNSTELIDTIKRYNHPVYHSGSLANTNFRQMLMDNIVFNSNLEEGVRNNILDHLTQMSGKADFFNSAFLEELVYYGVIDENAVLPEDKVYVFSPATHEHLKDVMQTVNKAKSDITLFKEIFEEEESQKIEFKN